MSLLKLKPAKPAKGCSWEGVGERVKVGDVDGDVVVVVVTGDWAVGSDGRVDEKTVRSFWREREGERRPEGMVVVFFGGVL